jgi:hypothetical protein
MANTSRGTNAQSVKKAAPARAARKKQAEMDAKIDASIAARKQRERAQGGMYPEGYERAKKEDAQFNEEFRKKFGLKNGGKVFKPCAGCPHPAKCKKAGKCLKSGHKAATKKKAAPKKYMCGGKVKKK